MPSLVLTNVKAVVNGSDLSAYVHGITLNYEAGAVVETAMGDTTTVNLGGVKSWGGTLAFKQDYDDNAIDEILFAIIGSQVTFSAVPVNAVVSANNPNYNGTALLTGYAPINGSHGELAKGSLAFVSAGPLSRSVAP
jgi:hypothetical protein